MPNKIFNRTTSTMRPAKYTLMSKSKLGNKSFKSIHGIIWYVIRVKGSRSIRIAIKDHIVVHPAHLSLFSIDLAYLLQPLILKQPSTPADASLYLFSAMNIDCSIHMICRISPLRKCKN